MTEPPADGPENRLSPKDDDRVEQEPMLHKSGSAATAPANGRLAEAAHLQAIEGNPLTAEESKRRVIALVAARSSISA